MRLATLREGDGGMDKINKTFDGYALYYDLFNSEKPYRKEIEFVYKWANKPESIFDIGCGTGSYWKYYPKNTRIIGIDKSPSMVNRSRGLIVDADIQEFDMRIFTGFKCATALFDVINYIPKHDWWARVPLEKDGYFIFDIWDAKKIQKDGFEKTIKIMDDKVRIINPISWNKKYVDLSVNISGKGILGFEERHRMYLHSHKDIEKFCGSSFKIEEIKPTERWQTWFKLKRR